MTDSVWPEGFQEPIANAVSMAAHIELSIEKIIEIGLWRNPDLGKFIINSLATANLIRAARLIVVEALPDKKDLAETVFKMVDMAREQRNKLLHRVWRPAADGSGLAMAPRRGRAETEIRDLGAFQKLADDLAEARIGVTLLQAMLTQAVDKERYR